MPNSSIQPPSGPGVGVGYRPAFAEAFFSEEKPAVSWIEVISENYFRQEGRDTRALQNLRKLRQDFPVALHGVSLSLGSCDPLEASYLKRLAALSEEIQPWLVTDHLCWAGVGGTNLHDLLPFPFHGESLRLVAEKIEKVQERLRRPLALENISFYALPMHSEMREEEFLNELARRTGCRYLLDVNNIYVNSVNLGIDPKAYLERLDLSRVAEIHLAGHGRLPSGVLADSHGAPVSEAVWALYEWVQGKVGLLPAMIERDENIPEWAELDLELDRLRRIRAKEASRETFGMAEARS